MSAEGNHLQNLGAELLRLEREDPAVAKAAASYERTRDRILQRGPGLSPTDLARLYDVETPLDPEWEIHSEGSPACDARDVSPGQS